VSRHDRPEKRFNNFRKNSAILLIVASLIFGLLPTSVFAAETSEEVLANEETNEIEEEALEEVTEEEVPEEILNETDASSDASQESSSEETVPEEEAPLPEEDTLEEDINADVQETEEKPILEEQVEDSSLARTGGSSMTSAVKLTLGTQKEDKSSANGYYWYKFTTTSNNSFYRIRLWNISGTSGCAAYLLDSDGNQIDYFYAGKGSSDFEDNKLKKSTTYYVRVTAYSGTTYKLVSAERKDDANDSKGKANALTLGKTFTRAINAEYDVDWYKFTTTGKNSFYRVKLKNVGIDAYCYAVLYNSNGTQETYLLANKGIVDLEDIKIPTKGTYYLQVYSSSYSKLGKYQIGVHQRVDDANDTKSGSKTLALGKAFNGAINAQEDVDWFKFKTTSTGKYRATLRNISIDSNCWAIVYTSDGTAKTYVLSGEGEVDYYDFKLTGNKTYYVKVYASSYKETGKYRLLVNKK